MTFSEKHIVHRWTVEARPGGGFIARSDDPSDAIEAETREEIEAKLGEKMASLLKSEAPGLDVSQLSLGRPGHLLETPMRAKFTFTLGGPSSEALPEAAKPATRRDVPPGAIEPAGSSLLSAIWKAAVLVGIAIIIWLLLNRR